MSTPTNPDLDYSACDSDRRHVVNVSVRLAHAGPLERPPNAIFGDWQIAPLVRWQSGSPYTVTTGVDNALSGTGEQRAVQMSDNIYGDKSVNNYLNASAFGSPAPGTYSTLKPNAFYGPSRLQNDLALTRTFNLRTARVPVPLGNVQRAEHGALQQPDLGAEQLQLRPDPERGRSAYHAVRVQVRFLTERAGLGARPAPEPELPCTDPSLRRRS